MKDNRDFVKDIKYCTSRIEENARLIRMNIDNWEHPKVMDKIDECIKELTKYIAKIMGEWEWLKESKTLESE